MEIEIDGKKYTMKKISWKDEKAIEEKRDLAFKAKKVDYYKRYMEKIEDDPERSIAVLEKMNAVEDDYYNAFLEVNLDTIIKATGVDMETLEKLTLAEIIKLSEMVKNYSSSLINDSSIVDVMGKIMEYAIGKGDDELIALLEQIEGSYFDIKKK